VEITGGCRLKFFAIARLEIQTLVRACQVLKIGSVLARMIAALAAVLPSVILKLPPRLCDLLVDLPTLGVEAQEFLMILPDLHNERRR
jgi:hypothetical protein